MQSRRDFLKQAALLTSAGSMWGVLPTSIAKALAIDPDQGTTFLDAEHIVILMQENRSFDHTYGRLQGVRGYNDPRIHKLPNGNPAWLQTNATGETFSPFHLDIKKTNATWMGSLPHSWTNQVDARNNGAYDKWLHAKPSGNKAYSHMPLTLGFYDREDIPFYYAFADAFTVCDMNFCSSLTGTTPNRLYLWTGKIRESDDDTAPANVRNEEVDYGREATWTTFPERLEDWGISWKIYQNEISLDSGFTGEQDAWLANFTDNPIEWFTQFRVRHASGYQGHLRRQAKSLPSDIDALKKQPETDETRKQIAAKEKQLKAVLGEMEKWSPENFEKLSERDKNIHRKAFAINSNDPDYRSLTELTYDDEGTERKVMVPKGDVLHQFREDVENGQLPTVTWLVAPEAFSDHPGSAWYGAWYVAETLDILTKNPEVWKKTILILTYDENDGYFDHVPPFVAPNPKKPETGLVSKGIDASVEFVQMEDDLKRKPAAQARESSIGLGYRVPMVIASPWSRGGCVNSEVCDHTSVLQFLEVFLSSKTGKKINEPNISAWRRTVCGDLTSVFQPYHGEKIDTPPTPTRDEVIQGIHKARFKKLPSGYKGLTPEEIQQAAMHPSESQWMPKQEKGTRRSCPLPYQLSVNGSVTNGKLTVRFEAGNTAFGKKSAGSPFNAYAYLGKDSLQARSYAVIAGDSLTDSWEIGAFADGRYHLRIDGPNGFMREFKGSANEPKIDVLVGYSKTKPANKAFNGNVDVQLVNRDTKSVTVDIRDHAYGLPAQKKTIPAGGKATLTVSAAKSHGWYDFSVFVAGSNDFERRAAGRVETGQWSITDPVMGRV